MALGFVLAEVPGATPKKPASGLIARRQPCSSGRIQAMSSPTVQTFQPSNPGRDEHGEICFSAGAGKCGSDVSFLTFGIFDAQDEHVLGHPAFVARDVGSDAQCKTLFSEKRVATVAGTV